MRLSPDRREQHADLGETSVEATRVRRPLDRLDPVPERFGLGGVVEQDRVAQVAQGAAGDRMHLGFVA
jgi:hypothetical protein